MSVNQDVAITRVMVVCQAKLAFFRFSAHGVGSLYAAVQTEQAFPPTLDGVVKNSWLAIICNGVENV